MLGRLGAGLGLGQMFLAGNENGYGENTKAKNNRSPMFPVLFVQVLSVVFILLQPEDAHAFTSLPCRRQMPSLLRTSILRASGDDKTSKERTPWDVLRFIGQSSKFITPPKLPFISNVMDGDRVRVQPG